MDNLWKKDFPVFSLPEQRNLHYFDSAATCLVPEIVAQSSYQYLTTCHANSHRGLYQLSQQATNNIEEARVQVKHFIGAQSADEICFCSGTSQAINFIAQGFIKQKLTANNTIIISQAEHHANFLPWQQLCQQTGASLQIIGLNNERTLDMQAFEQALTPNISLIAINHVSNVLGTTNPVKQICKLAQQYHIPVLVDGAQAAAHQHIDVQDIGCDFYAFSGHKIYAGTGCGVLYVNKQHIAEISPVVLGGGIVEKVTEQSCNYINTLKKLEAGSLSSASIAALSSAINYLEAIGKSAITQHIEVLSEYLHQQLVSLPFIELISPARQTSIVSFSVKGIHSHDVATLLDEYNIAVRVGHHCAQPLHQYLGIKSSVRVSLGLYNDKNDIDALISALKQCQLFWSLGKL
ncbi:aminotransferase class V-fold PLP-dependent enzyme [Thalassotalea sp. PLHSN55]|uniref:aminotransferase class V-fold PLP-dependent enzyme n=1 Tax=Thalassotalea sp. PLHSN55 TaxID=3435888 RepID=UPI003F845909